MTWETLANEVLKYYYDYADKNGRDQFTSCEVLVNRLKITQQKLDDVLGYLEMKKYLQISKDYVTPYCQTDSRITVEGIDYLESLNNSAVEIAPSPQQNITIMNSTITGSAIGSGNTVSATIENSFSTIRQLDLSDEDKQIIDEMEEETRKKDPSLDRFLEKIKMLGKEHRDTIAEEGIKILGALARSLIG